MPEHDDDSTIEPEMRKVMIDIARMIDIAANPERKQGKRNIGFVLLMFPFDNHEGRCNYISNAERKDIVVLFKEMISRFEGQPEMEGRA